MKTGFQSILFLCYNKQQVVTNGYPYLCIDSILGCAVECLDVQMLLNPFEEYLNLPSLPIQFSNRKCFNGKVIGEKAVDFTIPKIFIHYKSEICRGTSWKYNIRKV